MRDRTATRAATPRWRIRTTIAVLGLGVALFPTLSMAGCTFGGDPAVVSLADLVEQQDLYDGEVVVTEGIVHTYDDPRHYWIEDHDQNRVEPVPQEPVAPQVGNRVRVTGEFSIREAEGRRITLQELEVLTETPRADGRPVATNDVRR